MKTNAISRSPAFLLAGLAVLCAALAAQTRPADPAGDERILFDAANRERVARHLSALRWDASLARAAHDHAVLMARKGAISHQFPGEPGLSERAGRAGARFRLIEENVGEASNALELHDLWMKSPPHRENLLNNQIDAVGIAVVPSNGQLFAVVDFARLTPVLTLDDQERHVGQLLEARGLHLVKPSADVRKTCALDRGVMPGGHVKFLFRYTTGDLATLPEELVAELRKGSYESAAVGACSPGDEGSFTGYRIAVLLF